MKYLKLFKTQAEFDLATLELPNVSYIEENSEIYYNPQEEGYSKEYFTIEALENELTVKLSQNASQYRIDNSAWVDLAADTTTPAINAGQKIQFKMTDPTITTLSGIGTFTISKSCNIEGNIMSLLYGDDFQGQINLSGKNWVFCKLFYNCTTLQSAENLVLPATTLASYCYYEMFRGCTYLISTPTLPATTLAEYCYASMFEGCTSLTKAPELPAAKLEKNCYYAIFKNCSKLNYIKILATDISATNCIMFWVTGVAPSGTLIKTVAMSPPPGESGIPRGWIV